MNDLNHKHVHVLWIWTYYSLLNLFYLYGWNHRNTTWTSILGSNYAIWTHDIFGIFVHLRTTPDSLNPSRMYHYEDLSRFLKKMNNISILKKCRRHEKKIFWLFFISSQEHVWVEKKFIGSISMSFVWFQHVLWRYRLG